ncbi:MAG: pyruvate:ferredoxin (flavodoxin) oxidoreductase [Fastidiosipilaceae bacterium]|jgi:pyruvate-ferredoxin/flavodoxin oxidoreductase
MAKEKKYMTIDGNTAAAYSSYAFTEVAGIYPITPSSPMADMVDQWALAGRKNIFGTTAEVVEMQSEAGAAGVVHGSLGTGALTTTYTASQGLLLMIPNMYKISGELLPGVFHVSARALAAHALSIFGDHADVMSARQTGFAMLASSNVQEVTDLGAVAHLAAIKGSLPFMHFFDGFRTSHEIQKIEVQSYDDFASMVDWEAIKKFRARSLTPEKPIQRGTAQNPDIYFQVREAANPFYLAIPDIVEQYMNEMNALTGRDYQLFNYYGAEKATRVIVAMGSVCDTVKETVDFLNARGENVGLVNVHLYRPFSVEHMFRAMPDTVEKIAVLDRTKEPGAIGEPLYLDVVSAYIGKPNSPQIVGGRYGLGSKDTTPNDILAVFKNLSSDSPKHNFTLSIIDDVTNLSLPVEEVADVTPDGTTSCRFWGLGSDGTVGANKNSIKIIGDNTDMYAQAYFSYDSKKSGGVTMSDLRFGHTPILAPYLINMADFVSCSTQSYVNTYDMLSSLKPGGTFLLNTVWNDEELEQHLPASMKRYLAENDINFYVIDAVTIAEDLGLGNRTNTVLQSAFFKLTNIIPIDDAVDYMKKAIVKSYGAKGDDIVNMNYGAVDAGVNSMRKIDVPSAWKDAVDEKTEQRDLPKYVAEVASVMNAQEGDSLAVSKFVGYEDGHSPMGTTQYEKRAIATHVPTWLADNCIQCNQCSLVCPHGVIRPFLLTDEEAAGAPEEAASIQGMKPYDQYKYRIQVSVLDCTGCLACVQTCPAKEKALVAKPLEERRFEANNWDYFIRLPRKANPMKKTMIKGSQFEMPYLEFHGACAGCGETPYAKLVTQLFGNRMQISNATGCSSIWGGSAPSNPYTVDADGRGPAWANSLFEDNAEHGLGMHLGAKNIRNRVTGTIEALSEIGDDSVKQAIASWNESKDDNEKTVEASSSLIEALSKADTSNPEVKAMIDEITENSDYLAKRSTWILGGDGWAYDIGYGGLDHVLASGENVNVLVFDTEVYSNTGGQASKSTPTGAVAEFAAGGKSIRKKDLGMMAMSYGYVYVAQVAMGANQAQTLKAFLEAEAYEGPSLIIAYSPCINHGIRGGLRYAQVREKQAVEVGYWHLYRFDPRLEAEGKNPFTLDSKEPTGDYVDFLKGEVRYTSLFKKFPEEHVNRVFEQAAKDAAIRTQSYLRKAAENWELTD